VLGLTLGVNTLTPEQLARKWAIYRAAKKPSRQRTIEHIERVEKRVKESSSEALPNDPRSDSALAKEQQRSLELEEELSRLRQLLAVQQEGSELQQKPGSEEQFLYVQYPPAWHQHIPNQAQYPPLQQREIPLWQPGPEQHRVPFQQPRFRQQPQPQMQLPLSQQHQFLLNSPWPNTSPCPDPMQAASAISGSVPSHDT
jgi:hypothetical protein